jgi:hypothetical protein
LNEKLRILQMLREGAISVDEASMLLEAVAGTDPSDGDADQDTASSTGGAKTPVDLPDVGRFRRLVYIPFIVSILVLILSGWGTYALFHRAQGRVTLGFVLLVILAVLAFLAAALALWATTVPWLHVRIRGAPDGGSQGTRIAFSLPLPLTLAGWGLRLAYRYRTRFARLDQETADRLDAAAALLAAMRQDLGRQGAEPISIDVSDKEERVQVYIG